MRTMSFPAMIAVVGLLSACAGGSQPAVTPTTSATESATGRPSESASPDASTTPPDAESTVPAPSPSGPADTPTGAGNAELSMSVDPGDGTPALHYTLVCAAGQPGEESSHPAPHAACAALKADPALLHRKPQPDRICTEQYGGPQKATVTGAVDGIAVEAAFSRTDGCGISAWKAAENLLGVTGASL